MRKRGFLLLSMCLGFTTACSGCGESSSGNAASSSSKAASSSSLGSSSAPQAMAAEDIYNVLLKSTAWLYCSSRDKEGARGKAYGSGCLINKQKRLVLTNDHVIANAKDITVFFADMKDDGQPERSPAVYLKDKERLGITGKVVARSTAMDLALVELPRLPEGVCIVNLAAKSAAPGQNVFSIGASGADPAKPDVSALWRYTTGQVRLVRPFRVNSDDAKRDTQALETTSPTNHGDSGGPMVNDRMQLVAVVAAFLG